MLINHFPQHLQVKYTFVCFICKCLNKNVFYLNISAQKVDIFATMCNFFSTYATDLSNMAFERFYQCLSKYLVQKIYFTQKKF